MNIYTSDFRHNYEMEKLTRLFFPFEPIHFFPSTEKPENEPFYAVLSAAQIGENTALAAEVYLHADMQKRQCSMDVGADEAATARRLAGLLFECYVAVTGYRPAWGMLTGIRPARLYRNNLSRYGQQETDRLFEQQFYVRPEKLSLLKETALREDEILFKSRPASVSIYLSVPFCPSRCSYCSFVSHSVERAADLIPDYVDCLCREIIATAELVKRLHLHVQTVYMGGGTPTTLSAEQLRRVLSLVRESFGTDYDELTVEAGRPDTITEDKLQALMDCGVGRISINPQTMNDAVLQTIGRRHTVAQTIAAFELARQIGFTNINMDLIAGLPGDTTDSFKDTLRQVVGLNPESVTVHALSMKRASRIVKNGELTVPKDGVTAGKMVDVARNVLQSNTYLPYYMYRQSKTVGNLENVGYAKAGYEGLYNVYIMDETHTILACGASAVSKLRAPHGGEIERIFNYKYPYEYIARFDEMLRRKQRVEEFYHEYPIGD